MSKGNIANEGKVHWRQDITKQVGMYYNYSPTKLCYHLLEIDYWCQTLCQLKLIPDYHSQHLLNENEYVRIIYYLVLRRSSIIWSVIFGGINFFGNGSNKLRGSPVCVSGRCASIRYGFPAPRALVPMSIQ